MNFLNIILSVVIITALIPIYIVVMSSILILLTIVYFCDKMTQYLKFGW